MSSISDLVSELDRLEPREDTKNGQIDIVDISTLATFVLNSFYLESQKEGHEGKVFGVAIRRQRIDPNLFTGELSVQFKDKLIRDTLHFSGECSSFNDSKIEFKWYLIFDDFRDTYLRARYGFCYGELKREDILRLVMSV